MSKPEHLYELRALDVFLILLAMIVSIAMLELIRWLLIEQGVIK
jgi:hypothetical protein